MEAVAKWDFSATGSDLLSFKKGDILKVLSSEAKESNWYHAEFSGKDGLVSANMIDITPSFWYYGQLNRISAEEILLQSFVKIFLIRQSAGLWFLSYKANNERVGHFHIKRHYNGKFSFFSDENGRKQFNSLNEVASFVKKHGWYSAPWWNPIIGDDWEPKKHRKSALEWSPN